MGPEAAAVLYTVAAVLAVLAAAAWLHLRAARADLDQEWDTFNLWEEAVVRRERAVRAREWALAHADRSTQWGR